VSLSNFNVRKIKSADTEKEYFSFLKRVGINKDKAYKSKIREDSQSSESSDTQKK